MHDCNHPTIGGVQVSREERLAEMLASADALASEWKAQAEAYRVELEVERTNHEKTAKYGARQLERAEAAEARVRELEAERVEFVNATMVQAAREGDTLKAQLAAANALLLDTRDDLDARGGTLSRKAWNRLETYTDELTDNLSAQPAPPRPDTLLGMQIGPGAVAPCNQPEAPTDRGEKALEGARDTLRELNPGVCTDHDRAVLEACAACVRGGNGGLFDESAAPHTCAARREAKRG